MHYIWYIYFGYFGHSAAHLFVHILLMLRKFRIFFRTFTRALGLFSSDTPDTPRTCITLGIFISDISNIKHFIYLCMLQKFRIFLGHLPEHLDCFFRIFQTLPGHVLHLAYLFRIFRTLSTSFICACSGSSTFFSGHIPEHQGSFVQPFRTVLAPQFICAHLADAMEVPHISRTFTQAPVPYCFEFPTSGISQIQAKYRGISQNFS